MTTRTKQLRAVVLAALMVLSVIAMGTAFVGTAAAATETAEGNVEITAFGDSTEDTSSVTINVNENEPLGDISIGLNQSTVGSSNDLNGVDLEFKFEFSSGFDLTGSELSFTGDNPAALSTFANNYDADASGITTSSGAADIVTIAFTPTESTVDKNIELQFTVSDVGTGADGETISVKA